MSATPWYRAGLKFECTGCGDCCTGAPGFVWVTQVEIQQMAAVVGLGVERFEGAASAQGRHSQESDRTGQR